MTLERLEPLRIRLGGDEPLCEQLQALQINARSSGHVHNTEGVAHQVEEHFATDAMATFCTVLGMGCEQILRSEGVIIDRPLTSSRCNALRIRSESADKRRAM
jgi:hypothetical protein